jgi:hypothetical protein
MNINPSARTKVFAACGWRCHYCGDPATTVDHIVPKSVGGPSRRWNLTAACRDCNGFKGSLRAVCPCHGCIEAERTFEGYSRPSNVKVKGARKVERLPHWDVIPRCNHIPSQDGTVCVKVRCRMVLRESA